MSRAFVKEQDVDTVDDLPDRAISQHPNDVTPEGARRIDAELASSRNAYAAAQRSGDRSALASASRDMRYWSSRKATARIVPPPENHDQVRFGATVTIERDDGRKTDIPDRRRGPSGSVPRIDIARIAVGEGNVR
jgi:hypothetical protein